MLSGRIDLQSRELHLTTRSHGHGTNQLVLENNPFLQSITLRSDDVTHVLTFESTESSIATVTGRRNGAGDGRRNGASRSGVKRGFERFQDCGFLPFLATAFSPLSGIGLGLRKLSPSMTTR